MNAQHQQSLDGAFASATAGLLQEKYDEAFGHLERAHVLGQVYVGPHVRAHWLMLRIAVHRREPFAVVGQAIRIVLGALGSAVGVVPIGNTGGTNISMFQRLPIAPELRDIMEGAAPTPPYRRKA